MKIPMHMQKDLEIVPTDMYWKKLQTPRGTFTVLIVSTTVGTWCFWMPAPMVTALRKGMEEMESAIEIAKVIPRNQANGAGPT